MIPEAYVSFEIAKLLKEKGFNENTLMVYMSYGDLCKCNRYDSISNSNYNDITKNYFECTAPTHQMACAWLREVYGIYVSAIPCAKQHTIVWQQNIINLKPIKEGGMFLQLEPHRKDYNSYEEAVEAALKYSLENLI